MTTIQRESLQKKVATTLAANLNRLSSPFQSNVYLCITPFQKYHIYGDCAWKSAFQCIYMEEFSLPASSSIIDSRIASSTDSTIAEQEGPQQSSSIQKASQISTVSRPAGITKPKQSKSRNGIATLPLYEDCVCVYILTALQGCSTCKAKRLKCDETKPSCNQCIKRKVVCGGYKKDFKWRAFPDASPRTSSSSSHDLRGGSDSTISSPVSFDQPALDTRSSTSRTCPSLRLSSILSSELTFPTPEQLLQDTRQIKPETSDHIDRDWVDTKSGIDTTPFDVAISSLSSIEHTLVRHQTTDTNPKIKVEEEIEEIHRHQIVDRPSVSSSYNLSSSSSPGSSRSLLFNQPRLASNSPEMLVLNFDRNTCGILSVKDGMSENPWRTLVWPMAKDSPALYHAISSLSAFHCSVSNDQMKVAGLDHMSQSINQLYKNINSMSTEVSLATSMALALADTWDTSISTGIEHVRGGSVLISNALNKMKRRQTTDTSTLRFLCKTWLYMDVISRLTSTQIDDTDVDCALWSQIDLLTNSDEIDPLLGCASTLFPIIGRIANLVRKVRKTASNSISLISKANELKQELMNWLPPSYLQKPEDPACDIQHSIQTAEAYQWATMLYLHQAVPEIPSRSAETLARKVLLRLATVPVQSRTVIVQIYPLLAASCEATAPDDRLWALERWTQMQRRMRISNIDRCIEVVKEVWYRRDQADAGGQQYVGTSATSMMEEHFARDNDETLQRLPHERTVRGRQHWAGIMQELKWEGEVVLPFPPSHILTFCY